jgi:hypothetical protein
MRHTKGQLVYNASRVFIDKHRGETTESYHDNDRLDLHRRSPVDRVRVPRQDRRKRKIQSCFGKCRDTIDRNHLRLCCNRIRQCLNIENKRRSIILKLDKNTHVKTKRGFAWRGERTFARFPVIGEHVAFWTGTVSRAQGVEARVGAPAIVDATFVDIFAQMSVGCQLSSRHILAAAKVGAVGVVTGALAGSVPVAQRAFVDIYMDKVARKKKNGRS